MGRSSDIFPRAELHEEVNQGRVRVRVLPKEMPNTSDNMAHGVAVPHNFGKGCLRLVNTQGGMIEEEVQAIEDSPSHTG